MAITNEYRMAYEIFTNKFNINGFDIVKKYHESVGLNSFEDFRFDSTPKKKAYKIYADTLAATLSAYLNEKVKITEKKEYDLSDLSIGNFVEEFDNVMRVIQTEDAPGGKPFSYTKFAGTSSRAIASYAWKKVQHFNAPLSDIWAQQIRKGTLTPERLTEFTKSPIETLDKAIKSKKGYSDDVKQQLTEIVLAQQAMKAAIKKRSYLSYLNLFNIGKYSRERKCLKMLNEKLEAYKKQGVPVDSVLPVKYTSNMLDKTFKDLTAYVNNPNNAKTYAPEKIEAEKPAQSNNELNAEIKFKLKEKQYEKKDGPGKIENREQAMQRMRDKNVLKADFDKILGDFGTANQKESAVSVASTRLHLRLSGTWSNFNLTDDPAQKEEIIKDGSSRVFECMYNDVLKEIPGKTTTEKLVMAQKLTNFIMSNYSPAATNTKYEEYGDNYYIKNATLETIKNDTAAIGSDNELKEALTQAQFELDVIEKVTMDLSNEFANDSSKRSEEIKGNEAPVKNHQLDMV